MPLSMAGACRHDLPLLGVEVAPCQGGGSLYETCGVLGTVSSLQLIT